MLAFSETHLTHFRYLNIDLTVENLSNQPYWQLDDAVATEDKRPCSMPTRAAKQQNLTKPHGASRVLAATERPCCLVI
jgi:hypothetical protein